MSRMEEMRTMYGHVRSHVAMNCLNVAEDRQDAPRRKRWVWLSGIAAAVVLGFFVTDLCQALLRPTMDCVAMVKSSTVRRQKVTAPPCQATRCRLIPLASIPIDSSFIESFFMRKILLLLLTFVSLTLTLKAQTQSLEDMKLQLEQTDTLFMRPRSMTRSSKSASPLGAVRSGVTRSRSAPFMYAADFGVPLL